MAEDDGLSRAPVLVVDLGAVFGGNRIHVLFSFRVLVFVNKFHSQGWCTALAGNLLLDLRRFFNYLVGVILTTATSLVRDAGVTFKIRNLTAFDAALHRRLVWSMEFEAAVHSLGHAGSS